eukprot:TRINITY_DN23946_c0_g1_i1.p1 TRINITY_DN23946_c0_g1~~TRINITY_DN23946_c0_g1_i1.p1  ORF type:complete len:139 (-),score=36.72 TRINITY_DN23946_c0_g1_i1:10-426(-)
MALLTGHNSSDRLALQEGGTELLRELLQFAPAVDSLVKVTPTLVSLLGSAHMRAPALHTLEALVVLGGRGFLASWGQQICTAMQSMLQQLQQADQREIRAIAQLFDAMVCAAPAEAPTLLSPIGCLLYTSDAADDLLL